MLANRSERTVGNEGRKRIYPEKAAITFLTLIRENPDEMMMVALSKSSVRVRRFQIKEI